eukprot:4261792-Alexandrium_andersonii.AAC.1
MPPTSPRDQPKYTLLGSFGLAAAAIPARWGMAATYSEWAGMTRGRNELPPPPKDPKLLRTQWIKGKDPHG